MERQIEFYEEVGKKKDEGGYDSSNDNQFGTDVS